MATSTTSAATTPAPLDRGAGVELLGPVHGSGYRDGAALVRRADGQIVQVGPLMYGLLECLDGRRTTTELAAALTERLGRRVDEPSVIHLARKLADQGLLAGTEQAAPPRPNPLLALRWKLLVTNPAVTRRIATPFAFLFRPWLLWPILAAFAVVCWFVLVDKGVASATAEAFHTPGLLLVVFALGLASAGLHELGHAAGCRYGGVTPGGMGAGLYLVWPAFYTDVTDAYRLDRRGRLRVDLGGLYFNAVVAVITTGAWLLVRRDALLLLVALQLLQMVKQLSPIIRADGYHILADATGVPDLYAHLAPTLRRWLPGHRHDPSALTGRARAAVTIWVVVVVPILLSLMLGAILLLPRLAATAWDSGRRLAATLPDQAMTGNVLGVVASLVQLLALALPVLGSALVTQRVVRTTARHARAWGRGRPGRQTAILAATAGAIAALAWAWWPSGQYRPVVPADRGTLPGLVQLLASPRSAARGAAAPFALQPGRHVALAMVPVGGPTKGHPTFLVLPAAHGSVPAAVLTSASAGTAQPASALVFPFTLPKDVRPGSTQALAVGSEDGGVVYNVEYAVVTVSGGAPVTQTNSAFAFAHCTKCTTVAVSFQVVLVVGRSSVIAPIDAAGALNVDCPACVTTALADQLVFTLQAQPSAALQRQLNTALANLDALPEMGANGTPAAVTAQVQAVQQEIETILAESGLLSTTTTQQPSPSATPSGMLSTPASPPTMSLSPTDTATTQPSTANSTSTSPTASSGTAPSPTPTSTPTSTPSPPPSPTPMSPAASVSATP
jgi:putative peptide zinc metalloprotease protein